MSFAFDLISDIHAETWPDFDWTGKATSAYCVVAGDLARDKQRAAGHSGRHRPVQSRLDRAARNRSSHLPRSPDGGRQLRRQRFRPRLYHPRRRRPGRPVRLQLRMQRAALRAALRICMELNFARADRVDKNRR